MEAVGKKITWQDVFTEGQKERLIDAVVDEIGNLQYSPALKDLLAGGIRLGGYSGGRFHTSRTLKITGEGKLLEDESYYNPQIFDAVSKTDKPVDVARLRYLIELCKITPNSILSIRQKIER